MFSILFNHKILILTYLAKNPHDHMIQDIQIYRHLLMKVIQNSKVNFWNFKFEHQKLNKIEYQWTMKNLPV